MHNQIHLQDNSEFEPKSQLNSNDLCQSQIDSSF